MTQVGCIGHDGPCCSNREQDLADAQRYRWLVSKIVNVKREGGDGKYPYYPSITIELDADYHLEPRHQFNLSAVIDATIEFQKANKHIR